MCALIFVTDIIISDTGNMSSLTLAYKAFRVLKLYRTEQNHFAREAKTIFFRSLNVAESWKNNKVKFLKWEDVGAVT